MPQDEEARREAARRRQARYRARNIAREKAHAEGDHSSCIPGRCDALPESADLDEPEPNGAGGEGGDVTGDVTLTPENSVSHREPPAGLGDRGGRLWAAMSGLKLGPAHVLLLERACRMADRQARLDEILAGGDWLNLVIERAEAEDGVLEVRVTVDRALGELRQHDVALKLLVAELRHAGRPATAAGATPPTEAPAVKEGAGGNVSSLAAIRSRRDTAG